MVLVVFEFSTPGIYTTWRIKNINNNHGQILQIGQHTHIFYPLAIEIAGTWHEMAIELTQEIGRHIITITETTGRRHSFSNAFSWLCKQEMRFLSTTPW